MYNFSCDSSLAPLEGCPCNHLCLKANRRDRALLGMHCEKKKCSNKVLAQCTMMFTCPHSKEVFMTVHESRPERSICSLRMCLWVLPVRFMFVFYIFVLTWYPLVTLYTMKYRASLSPKGQPLIETRAQTLPQLVIAIVLAIPLHLAVSRRIWVLMSGELWVHLPTWQFCSILMLMHGSWHSETTVLAVCSCYCCCFFCCA